jgi:7-cyano-7-deazaguanine synthase
MSEKAVCLFSGGLDSTTVLYYALREGFDVTALSFNYGQRHTRELVTAKALTKELKIKHHVVDFSLPWGGSALTDRKISLPKDRSEKEMSSIPVTYVPARNALFLAFASSLAEVIGAETIFIGANAIDYSGYPDCRPEFLESFEQMIKLATKAGVEGSSFKVVAPLLEMTKKEIVLFGEELGVPFGLTWSCYEGASVPCGHCDSCLLRAKGFQKAGIEDPSFAQ